MKKGLIIVLVVIFVILILGLGIVLPQKGFRKKPPFDPILHIQIPQNAFGPKVTRGVCMLSTGGFAADAVNGFVIWEKEGQVLIDEKVWNYIVYPQRVLSLNLTEGEPFEAASLTKLIDRSRELKGIRHRLVFRRGADTPYYLIVIKDGDSERVYEIDTDALDKSSTRRLHHFFEIVDETGASDVLNES
ncbi:MAG: hypothetical protein AMS15_07700 [Planctomycetes bacterium DG_23]|nr:MAG: hypothetical protein AMS15_07700 [Planctomycetes bacterium DG_23]